MVQSGQLDSPRQLEKWTIRAYVAVGLLILTQPGLLTRWNTLFNRFNSTKRVVILSMFVLGPSSSGMEKSYL